MLFKDVYAVLMKMLINFEEPRGEGEAPEDGGVDHTLGVVDEDAERGSEVCARVCVGVLTRYQV